MANIVLKCDVPGCDYETPSVEEIVAKRSLGVHKRVSHGIKGKKQYVKVKDRLKQTQQTTTDQVSRNTEPDSNYHKFVVICPHCSTLIKIETAKL